MIQIKYQAESSFASISSEDRDEAWSSLRRACEDHSEEVEIISETALIMPWWSFLTCRKQIAYILRLYNVHVDFGASAKQLLESAKARERTFEELQHVQSFCSKDIIKKISDHGFKRKLTAEQIRNVATLVSLPAGATFSVPGAGKTTEALAYFFFRKTPETRLLVLAPINAFSAWEEQLMKCVPSYGHKIVRLRGGLEHISQLIKIDPYIMLMSYHQFARAKVRNIMAAHISKNPTFLFLDESHRIKKGVEGKIGSKILSISHLPISKLILTGTPLPNSIEDLVPQFSFLYPEIEADTANVVELIQCIHVRTTKDELKLPPVSRNLISIPMSPAQRRLYDLMRSEEARKAEGLLDFESRHRLRLMGRNAMRLLQVASNPSLLIESPSFEYPELLTNVLEEGDCPKIQWVCERARELTSAGNKVIIWSSFVRNVELIANRLIDLGADFIHGGVEAGSEEEEDTREAKISRFHSDDKALVLVANPAAASEGISLHTVCHHAIYMDRTYNAAHYLQSEDRIHRLGLGPEDDTFIEIVTSRFSIDKSVQRRLSLKVEMMAKVLNDESLNINPVEYDPYTDGFDEDDMKDFVQHLRGNDENI